MKKKKLKNKVKKIKRLKYQLKKLKNQVKKMKKLKNQLKKLKSENEYYKDEYKMGIKEGKGEVRYSNGKKFISLFYKWKNQNF